MPDSSSPPTPDDLHTKEDLHWMQQALSLARQAWKTSQDHHDVPVAAIITQPAASSHNTTEFHPQQPVATATNSKERHHNPIAHAEILAIEQASQTLKRWRLNDCTLYCTMEPCLMCAGAIIQARLHRIVFGAYNPKFGAFGSLINVAADPRINHRLIVTPRVLEQESRTLIQNFFAHRRASKSQNL